MTSNTLYHTLYVGGCMSARSWSSWSPSHFSTSMSWINWGAGVVRTNDEGDDVQRSQYQHTHHSRIGARTRNHYFLKMRGSNSGGCSNWEEKQQFFLPRAPTREAHGGRAREHRVVILIIRCHPSCGIIPLLIRTDRQT